MKCEICFDNFECTGLGKNNCVKRKTCICLKCFESLVRTALADSDKVLASLKLLRVKKEIDEIVLCCYLCDPKKFMDGVLKGLEHGKYE